MFMLRKIQVKFNCTVMANAMIWVLHCVVSQNIVCSLLYTQVVLSHMCGETRDT